MTAYFDRLCAEVSKASCERGGDDKAFLEDVAHVEEVAITAVSWVTGDREFPADLREKIWTHIACLRVDAGDLPPTQGREDTRCSRASVLLDALHSDFHALARRRIMTRFGLLNDDPSGILARRRAHDEDHGIPPCPDDEC